MRLRTYAIVALVAAAGLSGCGGGPKLVSVSGTVLLNGKPFKDADIVFIPDSSNKNGMAGADKTGPEGNYTAMTSGRLGLVPGKYKVVVSRVTLLDTGKVPREFKDDPIMAQLVLEGPNAGTENTPPPKKNLSTEIKGEVEREIPPQGGTQDFDVKAEVSKS